MGTVSSTIMITITLLHSVLQGIVGNWGAAGGLFAAGLFILGKELQKELQMALYELMEVEQRLRGGK